MRRRPKPAVSDQQTNHTGSLGLQRVPFEDLYRFSLSNDNFAPSCGELCWVLGFGLHGSEALPRRNHIIAAPLETLRTLRSALSSALRRSGFCFRWLVAGRNESRGKLKLSVQALVWEVLVKQRLCTNVKRAADCFITGPHLKNFFFLVRALSLFFTIPRV